MFASLTSASGVWGHAPIKKKHGESRRDKGSRAIPTLGFAACYRRDARTLMERVFPRNQLHPLHIGRGLGKVDVSFSSFLCAREKDKQKILLRIRRTKEVVTLQGDPAIVWHAICIVWV